MHIDDHDRSVLRNLAEHKAEIAALPIHTETTELWRRTNQLAPTRPPVWINELPWHEIEKERDELQLQSHDPGVRSLERQLRQELYQWSHFPCDMIVEPVIYSSIVINDTGFGIEELSQKIYANEGSVASRGFEPQIKEPADIDKIQMPEVSVDESETDRHLEVLAEAVGDLIPVTKRGIPGRWFAPWDELIRWWGVEKAMQDLVDRPDMVHAAMDRLVDAYICRLDQWEALSLLSSNNGPVRIGSGGFGHTDELPPAKPDEPPPGPADIWGCATAQIFSGVSPAMHDEFALQYERRWLDRFGLTYYGCCEPLHLKIEILARVPNLRKISCSPWADIAVMAEKADSRYVISHKPNPAILAEDDWNLQRARAMLCDALERSDGCPLEIILKDVSTVRFAPARLDDWARMAMDVVGAA